MDIWAYVSTYGWIAYRKEESDKQVGFQELVAYEFREILGVN